MFAEEASLHQPEEIDSKEIFCFTSLSKIVGHSRLHSRDKFHVYVQTNASLITKHLYKKSFHARILDGIDCFVLKDLDVLEGNHNCLPLDQPWL